MSDLWGMFVDRLVASGYTLEDFVDNEGLLRLVAEEFCGFTPQQVRELQKQWQSVHQGATIRMMKPRDASHTAGRAYSQMNGKPAFQGSFSVYSTSTVLSRATRFLSNLSKNGSLLSSAMVTELPLPRRLTQSFRGRLASMHNPTGEVELMWKLCSPSTLASIREGRSLGTIDNRDRLCSCGIVLYRDDGDAAEFQEDTPVELVHQGWCLVAFDTAIGKSRHLEAEEIQLVQHFSMKECFHTLNSDGYDSILITPCNAIAIFHPDQIVPRFIVTVHASNTHLSSCPSIATAMGHHDMTSYQLRKGENLYDKVQPKVVEAIRGLNVANAPHKLSADTSLDATMCHKHPGKEVEFWCSEEKQLLCSHCLFYDGYSSNNCVLVAEAARKELQDLNVGCKMHGLLQKRLILLLIFSAPQKRI
ncbi:poly [ADP-ribose] polymerase [Trypanosoma rangeli]|uniref:Poly [ADP-ribose] polymerase n=1 Tax=Trypanosoma rangeli TaxID=5698 RepID=A0A3R7K3W1_TRYRA|nr:poly [ADP-ribose] polymerase [Trypanosoma rangeli]RNF01264.1 poly [ADP-ribose] polymerase [Trypanosoma rangeli]|eukprot:RNF01264.1 poly [ADP-ribose] polymerase [Trypanosoma rangeli]